MKSKRPPKNRSHGNVPAWVDRNTLERVRRSGAEHLARQLQDARQASIRNAELRATALSPLRALIQSKWPEIADAGRVGLEKVHRQLDRKLPLDPAPSPPRTNRDRPTPDPVFTLLGCRLPPYDLDYNTNTHGGTSNHVTGELSWQNGAEGTTDGKIHELRGNPAVGIYYPIYPLVQSSASLMARVTATVSARVFKGSALLFGDAYAELSLQVGVNNGPSGSPTYIYPEPYTPPNYGIFWGTELREIASRTYEATTRISLDSSINGVSVWAILNAHVTARGIAVARIQCAMKIKRICVDIER